MTWAVTFKLRPLKKTPGPIQTHRSGPLGRRTAITLFMQRNTIGMMPNADFLAERQKYYAGILNDLFDPTPHMNSIRIFEFVCALVRTGGLELGGFDPWYESKAIIDLATAKKYVFDRLTDGRFHPKVAKIFRFTQTVGAYKYPNQTLKWGRSRFQFLDSMDAFP